VSDNAKGLIHSHAQGFEACERVGMPVGREDLKQDPAHGQIGTAIRFPGAGEFHPLLEINAVPDY